MNKLVGLAAAAVLILVVIFDVAKESVEIINLGPTIVLIAFGVLMWALFSKLARRRDGRDSGMPINVALWSHSFLEGALAALSFSFSLRAGVIISIALLVHLIPESLAVIATLKQSGFNTLYAIRVYAISVVILLASFSLLGFVLPKSSETILTAMTTLVAGGFIYLAVRTARKTFTN